VGFPRFRRKHGRRDSFRLTGSSNVPPRSVRLPRIGCVWTRETTEKLRGRILSASRRREADRCSVSLAVGMERPDPQPVGGAAVGLGPAAFAALSDGTGMEAPKPLARALRRQRQRQQRHRRQSALGLARCTAASVCWRADSLHQATAELAKTEWVIVVEDLCVRGMIRHRHLARSSGGAGGGALRRMLENKTPWQGSRRITAPRFHPSTKGCSACGGVPRTGFRSGERVFRCGAWGRCLTGT
jgi:putative transposase